MKTCIRKPGLATALISLLALSACIPSVNPLFTPETTVFHEELCGVWKEEPQDEESWTFTKADDTSYKVTITDDGTTANFEGRLVKLGETLFLDLFPTDEALEDAQMNDVYKSALVPGHLIFKAKLGSSLELAFFNPENLSKMLTEKPESLAHGFPRKGHLVITASTADLQKFLTAQANNPELWSEPAILQKLIL